MTISYKKFLELINGGESYRVDFKIKCDAFASSTLAPKAELIKDICALSNNGNVTSFLIIGVSDDRQTFNSVKNKNLKDETIQDYCKRNIYPPPKLQIFLKKWSIGLTNIRDKEFFIIQIGPHKKQAFRFLLDIIDYRENICFRRNEVWIRRGTTSDIATPEEVSKLVAGESIHVNDTDQAKEVERNEYSRLSQSQKKDNICLSLLDNLHNNGITSLPKNEYPKIPYFSGSSISLRTLWKWTDNILFLYHITGCLNKLNRSYLLSQRQYLVYDYSVDYYVPKRLIDKFSSSKGVRRILILPVLSKVPRTRLQDYLDSWQWSGKSLYFFHNKSINDKSGNLLPISTELIVIDNILSITDFKERCNSEISYLENNSPFAPVLSSP